VWRVLAFFAVVAVLASACSSNSPAVGPDPGVDSATSAVPVTQVLDRRVVVRVGTVATIESAPLQLALNRDEFSNNGVAVRPVPIVSGRTAVTGVINGSIDVGYAPATDVIQAFGSGLDLRILLAGPRSAEPGHVALVSREPGATSLTRLPPGTIAVPAQSVLSELALRIQAAEADMAPNHFEFLALTPAESLEALANEQLVGAVVDEPYLRAAVHDGAAVLGRPLRELGLDLQLGYWFTSVDALRNKRQAINRTAQVLREVNADADDFTGSISTIAIEEAGLSETGTPKNLVQPLWDPTPDPTSLEQTAQLLNSYGLIPAIPDLDQLTNG